MDEPVNLDCLRVGCDRTDPRYNPWSGMIQRCYNVGNVSYIRYGERGTTVCPRWLAPYGEGFKAFCTDMGPRPDSTSLDRRDNTKGYSAENCRWASQQVQQMNRGLNKNNTSGCKGVLWSKTHKKWKAQIAYNYKTIYLGLFSDIFEAICARKSAENRYFAPSLENAG